MGVAVERSDVYLVNLDPTIGSEIKETRPCLVISPDEMNRHLRTVIVAPLTSQGRLYPTRVRCLFDGKEGLIVLDQIRTVDVTSLVRKVGRIESAIMVTVLAALGQIFAE
ncbi:MAG TPA: type II toxin-antitoxin system PemK/MazF family toxin [Thermoanaerobaculia bacterium]|nr:type II toxin-antitoxin system PemK/MazF family toxin [Thermoanaerobaculia bacterium]